MDVDDSEKDKLKSIFGQIVLDLDLDWEAAVIAEVGDDYRIGFLSVDTTILIRKGLFAIIDKNSILSIRPEGNKLRVYAEQN